MEVKELNTPLASLMTFGRVNAAAPGGSDAFAQLLSRPEKEDRAAADFGKKEVKETRPERSDLKADKKSRPVSGDKADAPVENKKNRRTAGKAKAEAPENAPEKNVSSNDNQPAADKTLSAQAPQTPVADNASAPVEQPAVSAENMVEAEVPVGGTVAKQQDGGASEGLSAAMVVSLDVLALMGTVNVINPQNGETVQMTGAELAAQLSAGGNFLPVQQPSEGGEPVIRLVPAEQAAVMPDAVSGEEGLDISLLKPLDDGESVEVDMAQVQAQTSKKTGSASEKQTSADELAGDKIEEQAAKLGEIIGEDKKVSVKVSAQEEKIARLGAKDLLSDAKTVDEAVSVSAKPADVSAKINAEASNQPAQPAAPNGNAQNMSAVPMFNAAAPAAVQPAEASVVPAAANAETAPLNLSASVAAGGEFVKAAKADSAAESQTSFRDVYKGMGREAVEQVKVNITKSAVKGIDKIDISLKPEELGHIEVKMQIGKDGKLQAHIISSRPDTMEALQKEMQTLEKAFNDAGFQTDEGSLSFSFRDGGQANQNQERDGGLRHFIGGIFEQEASNDLLNGEAFQNQSWDGKSGLNIRV